MDSRAREAYLSNQVNTATPQKLRLMLIDGAIRFATEAREFWEDDFARSRTAIGRCRECVAELLSAVRPKVAPKLVTQVSSVYLFLFRMLTEIQIENTPEHLEDVLRVLEVERETWRMVCEQMPEAPDDTVLESVKPREITASNHEAIAPPSTPTRNSFTGNNAPATSRGFSLDA